MRRIIATIVAVAAVTLMAGLAGVTTSDGIAFGEAKDGLRIGLRQVEPVEVGGRPRFEVVFQNTDADDLMLHLGIMLNNGRQQYMKHVELTVFTADGGSITFEQTVGSVAGRVDPMVLTLPDGGQFSAILDTARMFPMKINADLKNSVWTHATVAFNGTKVELWNVNDDLVGMTLMPVWEGAITSEKLEL